MWNTEIGAPGAPRENHGARLGNVARAARAVDGEGDVAPFFETSSHRRESFDPPSRRAALSGAKTETLNHPPRPLPIEIHCIQHHDSPIAPHPCRRKDAAVPEGPDARFAGVANLNGIVHTDHFEAKRGAQQSDDLVDHPRNHGNLESAPAREYWRANSRLAPGISVVLWHTGVRSILHCCIV